MQNQISSKTVALTFGVLVILFAVSFYIFAWQEPTQAPPGGNVAAPLNVSAIAQTKEGDLTVNGVLKTLKDMIVNIVTIKGDGSISDKLNADKLDSYHAADLMAAGSGGGGVLVTWGSASSASNFVVAGTNAPACPSGWTQVYVGYGPYWIIRESESVGHGFVAVSEICGTDRREQLSGQIITGAHPIMYVDACSCSGNLYTGSCGVWTCNTCRVCVK